MGIGRRIAEGHRSWLQDMTSPNISPLSKSAAVATGHDRGLLSGNPSLQNSMEGFLHTPALNLKAESHDQMGHVMLTFATYRHMRESTRFMPCFPSPGLRSVESIVERGMGMLKLLKSAASTQGHKDLQLPRVVLHWRQPKPPRQP